MNRKEFISIITFSLPSLCVLGNEPPLKIEVQTKRVCNRCKDWLGKCVMMQKGIRNVVIDVTHQHIVVSFNPSKTNAQTIKNYIVSIGYDADTQKADVNKRYILRDCCFMDITYCK